MLFPLARNVLCSLKNRSIQQILARQSYIKYSPDLHDKYGNTMLASKTTFCFVSILVITQIGIEWNLSFGRVIPKE
ncbi:cytochrome c oxidase subunit 7B2, mitochondrial-like [Pteropus vampyrus]|uniref:Cytochrome c oxidase subunit 7B2, mitochondrial-like n=1 Tax=Pteropus vampyrus TaxID=132908 RepID=A0A6P3QEK4_PTEVA|nr:cytochrome c oxidase subunit 7B2, mitochondrial-like [Pteropus vampyrus]